MQSCALDRFIRTVTIIPESSVLFFPFFNHADDSILSTVLFSEFT